VGHGCESVVSLLQGGHSTAAPTRHCDYLDFEGAAIGGSPISGGYAGAKRMQMFLANYAQKESDRLGLDLRFLAVTPLRPMVDTEGGRAAVMSYTKYLGISPEEFIRGLKAPQTAQDVADAVLNFVATPPYWG